MSMEPSVTSGTFCLACSAVGDPGAAYCWMCGSSELRTLGPVAPAVSPPTTSRKDPVAWHLDDEIARPRPHSLPRFIKPGVLVLILFLAGAFVLGLWKESPGLAVVLALIITVVIVTTLGSGGASSSPGEPGGRGAPINRGARVAGSILHVFGVLSTIALVVVVAVVAWVIFAINSCLAMLGGHR